MKFIFFSPDSLKFGLKVFLIAFCLFSYSTKAQQLGSLDESFGTGGVTSTSLGITINYAKTLVIQPDGKIVTAGVADYNSHFGSNHGLVRYNKNGTLDTSFGTSGSVVYDIAPLEVDAPEAIALQTDGKIITVGDAGFQNYCVVRYNEDGSLDSNFGSNGVIISEIISTGYTVANSVIVQPDGKILVSGFFNNKENDWYDVFLVRYNSDGTLDRRFGIMGKVIIGSASNAEFANSIILQDGGNILVVGSRRNSKLKEKLFITKYNSRGSLVSDFGIGGSAVMDFMDSSSYLTNSAIIQSDGKIVVGGIIGKDNLDYNKSVLVRFQLDGTLDTDFGTDGMLISEDIFIESVVSDANGKILAGGAPISEGGFVIARYSSDGKLDNDFGNNGYVFTNISGNADHIFDMVIQEDGKLVAAGRIGSYKTNMISFGISRYNTVDYSLSTSIGSTSGIKNTMVYPVPSEKHITIDTNIDEQGYISIFLVDGQGKVVCTFIKDEKVNTGRYKSTFSFPDNLPAANYLINIRLSNGKQRGIKVVKQYK